MSQELAKDKDLLDRSVTKRGMDFGKSYERTVFDLCSGRESLRRNGTGSDRKSEEYLFYVDITIDSKHQFRKWLCLILCVMSISVDSLFLYIPIVNNDKKCIVLDRDLSISVSLLRSFCDFIYIIDIILHQRWSYSLRFFLIDLLAILPLPQLAIFDVFPTLGGLGFWNRMELLKLCVTFQYVPRVIRVYHWISGKLAGSTLAKAAFSGFLYILAASVFGALWYFLAIEREIECWRNAFVNHRECSSSSFYCDDNLGDYSFLNEFCPIKGHDASIYDLGIFHDAVQSGIVEVTDVPHKFLHCFLWGLKNLSSLGRNLPTSIDLRQNLFVISIIICGLVLRFFLVGYMLVGIYFWVVYGSSCETDIPAVQIGKIKARLETGVAGDRGVDALSKLHQAF